MPYLCAMLIKRPGGFPEPNTNSYEFRKKKQVKRDFQIGVAVRKTQWL